MTKNWAGYVSPHSSMPHRRPPDIPDLTPQILAQPTHEVVAAVRALVEACLTQPLEEVTWMEGKAREDLVTEALILERFVLGGAWDRALTEAYDWEIHGDVAKQAVARVHEHAARAGSGSYGEALLSNAGIDAARTYMAERLEEGDLYAVSATLRNANSYLPASECRAIYERLASEAAADGDFDMVKKCCEAIGKDVDAQIAIPCGDAAWRRARRSLRERANWGLRSLTNAIAAYKAVGATDRLSRVALLVARLLRRTPTHGEMQQLVRCALDAAAASGNPPVDRLLELADALALACGQAHERLHGEHDRQADDLYEELDSSIRAICYFVASWKAAGRGDEST